MGELLAGFYCAHACLWGVVHKTDDNYLQVVHVYMCGMSFLFHICEDIVVLKDGFCVENVQRRTFLD